MRAPPTRHAACTKSGKGLVGERISVFWEDDAAWYSGSIREYTEATETHLVVYDDGDQRHEELSDPALQWKLLASSAPPQRPDSEDRPEPPRLAIHCLGIQPPNKGIRQCRFPP